VTTAAVLGMGSWGTAFAAVLVDAGCQVRLFGGDPVLASAVTDRHENPVAHPGVALPPALVATTDLAHALAGADLVVLAVPAQELRRALTAWSPLLPRDAVLVSLIKGVELGTTLRMSEVITEVAAVPDSSVVVVSGPNLAGEVLAHQPAATVVASVSAATAQRVQAACHTWYFRPYTNTDVVGTELGGAVKNVIALAVGMAAGLGFGENTQASLLTRGLAEIARLGAALGADPATFAGLAGLGDLVATCSSPLSRNRTFGVNLGRGMSVAEAGQALHQTAEGVKSAPAILALADAHGVDMPITAQVVRVLRDGVAPAQVVGRLMGREAKPEQAAGR